MKPVPLMLKRIGRNGARKRWIVSHYMEYHDKSGLDPDKIPECSECRAHFRAPMQLHNHAKEIHGKLTNRECSDCGKIIKKIELLRAHRISIHKVYESTFQFLYTFRACEHRFERQIELDYHENNAHRRGTHSSGAVICPECGKKLLGNRQLTVHLRGHEIQAKKEEEKAKMKEERMLNKLEKKKVEAETVVCDRCGRSFANKRLLQAHIKRHVEPHLWKFVCQEYGKKCPTRRSLTKHNRSHTEEKPYVCQVCGKAFSNSTNFKIHTETKH